MPGSSDLPDDQPFTPFDRDRQRRRIGKLGKLDEQRRELLLAVPDQPSLDDHTVIVDHAHPVLC